MRALFHWIGKACSYLTWAKFYFVFPPEENSAEEMRVYNERMRW